MEYKQNDPLQIKTFEEDEHCVNAIIPVEMEFIQKLSLQLEKKITNTSVMFRPEQFR